MVKFWQGVQEPAFGLGEGLFGQDEAGVADDERCRTLQAVPDPPQLKAGHT